MYQGSFYRLILVCALTFFCCISGVYAQVALPLNLNDKGELTDNDGVRIDESYLNDLVELGFNLKEYKKATMMRKAARIIRYSGYAVYGANLIYGLIKESPDEEWLDRHKFVSNFSIALIGAGVILNVAADKHIKLMQPSNNVAFKLAPGLLGVVISFPNG